MAPPAEVVRPVRSCIVAAGVNSPDLDFPGVVKAGTSRELAFEVPGRLQTLPVKKNQRVKKGDVVATLDPKDFEDALAKAKAALERDRLTFKRVSAAAKKNAVSAEEVSSAEAKVKTDEAECATLQRALEHTTLVAPLDGVIANTYPDELDMLSVGQKVATLMNTDRIDVEVSMPETLVIRANQMESVSNACHVTFDSYPSRSYPAKLVEFTAIADPRTQIYKTTFTLPKVPDLTLLPGMSATINLKGSCYSYKGSTDAPAAQIAVPSSAVGVDADGTYFVWKLTSADAAKGTYTAHRSAIRTGTRIGTSITVHEGVAVGDRVVTAGVSQISEGRTVTLLKERAQ